MLYRMVQPIPVIEYVRWTHSQPPHDNVHFNIHTDPKFIKSNDIPQEHQNLIYLVLLPFPHVQAAFLQSKIRIGTKNNKLGENHRR